MAIHLSTERFVTWLTRALSMATATKKTHDKKFHPWFNLHRVSSAISDDLCNNHLIC